MSVSMQTGVSISKLACKFHEHMDGYAEKLRVNFLVTSRPHESVRADPVRLLQRFRELVFEVEMRMTR